MYFDLNIPIAEHLDKNARDKLKLILHRLSQLDDQVIVALNYTLTKYSATKLPILMSPIEYDNVKILKRITMETDVLLEESAWETLQSQYDLVALRTSDQSVFEHACQSKYIDIISLDCTQRLSFTLDPMIVKLATEHHIYFELQYAPGIRDDTSRGYVYQLGHALVSCQLGNYLVISSGAETVSEIRAPFDVYYFAKSFGLPNDLAKFPSWRNPQSLIDHKSL